jgi:hypothetical protein
MCEGADAYVVERIRCAGVFDSDTHWRAPTRPAAPMADHVGAKRRRSEDGAAAPAADGEMRPRATAVTPLTADGGAVAAGDNSSWMTAGEEVKLAGAAALWLNEYECGAGAAFVTSQ